MSDADTGYGSTFGVGNGATPEVFTNLAEVVNIGPPKQSRDAVETTHLTSPNATREYKPSLREPGEVKLVLNYIPAGPAETALQALFADDDVHNFIITYPNGATEAFAGFALTLEKGDLTPEGKMEANATIKVTGATEVEA